MGVGFGKGANERPLDRTCCCEVIRGVRVRLCIFNFLGNHKLGYNFLARFLKEVISSFVSTVFAA